MQSFGYAVTTICEIVKLLALMSTLGGFSKVLVVLHSHVPYTVDSMYDNTLDGDTITYE